MNIKDLNGLTEEQISNLKNKAQQDNDFKTLINIAHHHIKKTCVALSKYDIPKIGYYYGRLHDEKGLHDFIKENSGLIFFLYPESVVILASELFVIGNLFPNLNEGFLQRLDFLYCDNSTYDLMCDILYDEYLLPRPLKKLNAKKFDKRNTEFSTSFLKDIFNAMVINEGLDYCCDRIYVYDRSDNTIVQKYHDDVGRSEFEIRYYPSIGEMITLLRNTYGEHSVLLFVEEEHGIFPIDEILKDGEECSICVSAKDIITFSEKHLEKIGVNPIEEMSIYIARKFLLECNAA